MVKSIMTYYDVIQDLNERNLIAQITKKEILTQILKKQPITLYCGFDPTSDSLHLGHLIPLLCLKRFQNAGHRPIILIGGATGLIGDPSFKTKERKLNNKEIVQQWIENIKKQIYKLFEINQNSKKTNIIVVNNYDWFKPMSVVNFLRNIGKYFSVNKMINKKAIKQRLYHNNNGISFTEFAYNLLQGYDFAYLNKKYDAKLQIGGSDQWGNITSGINLTKRINQNIVYGLTVPLITTSNNNKFGKTENNAIWLDAKKTSPYKFYQFWINISDKDVYKYLKFFTFLDIVKINKIKNKKHTILHQPQSILADEITRIVHGEKNLTTAKHITKCLFTGKIHDLTEKDLTQLTIDGLPTIRLKLDTKLQEALVATQLVLSKNQARTMIEANAITINEKRIISTKYIFQKTDILYGRYTILRKGKKHHCLIIWE